MNNTKMSQNLINFDGGTWLARTLPGKEPQLPVPKSQKFEYAMDYMRKGIGLNGIVPVLNARGANDPNGADFRYEWLLDQGERKNNSDWTFVKRIEGGRAFFAPLENIVVLKGQPVWTPDLEFIFYGGPYRKNVNSKDTKGALEEACELGCICGISKIINPEKVINIFNKLNYLDKQSPKIDFIVTYRGTRTGFGNPNKNEEEFYKKDRTIPPTIFHKKYGLGVVAMSRGYNVRGAFGKPTVGTSYTEIPNINIDENFIENLRQRIRNTTLDNIHGSPIYSGVFTHGINMVLDKFKRRKNTIRRD